MKRIIYLFAIVALLLPASCSKNSSTQQKDEKQEQLDNLNEFLDIVAVCMDSINGQEENIFYSRDGVPLSNREQILKNLQLFKYNVEQQQKRIAQLEEQLKQKSTDDAQAQKLLGIINSLKAQLEEKNATIANLEAQLKSKDANIAQLRQDVDNANQHVAKLNTHVKDLNTHVSNLNTENERLDKENQQKDEQIAQKDQKIEELTYGYYRFGTKDELTTLGILKKGEGLFAKKKFDASGVNFSAFQKVNTQQAVTLSIPGKKPEIMTQHPAGSYSLSANSITITNPERFWSSSKVLVIKHK